MKQVSESAEILFSLHRQVSVVIMGLNKILNQFLAGILIMIYHLGMGVFIDRNTVVFSISLYIFVLTMIYLVGLPVDQDTGEIQEDEFQFRPPK